MDAWIANLSDGSTKQENWVNNDISPWQKLMEYCKVNHCYITNLRLTIGKETQACPASALGYWQAHGMPTRQGFECDEELHKLRGIGWVAIAENGQRIVRIIWGGRDPQTHDVHWWMESRLADTQGQIIWSAPELVSRRG